MFGEFRGGPTGDRQIVLGGHLAGPGFDRSDIGGGVDRRPTRSWGISECTESVVVESGAPFADGVEVDVEFVGDGVGVPVGGQEHDQ